MTVKTEPFTMERIAERTGLPEQQIYYAVLRGELEPGPRVGRRYTFTPEQVDMVERACDLVDIGLALHQAIRVVKAGWVKATSPKEQVEE